MGREKVELACVGLEKIWERDSQEVAFQNTTVITDSLNMGGGVAVLPDG